MNRCHICEKKITENRTSRLGVRKFCFPCNSDLFKDPALQRRFPELFGRHKSLISPRRTKK